MMKTIDLLDRLRRQVVDELDQDTVLEQYRWEDAADEAINAMSNVDLILRLEIVLNESETKND